jgi:hypothetical protein
LEEEGLQKGVRRESNGNLLLLLWKYLNVVDYKG